MNYSHAFHAGNFADVVKHAALARCLLNLSHDRAPLRIIDTHGGAGLYDLSGEAARKSGEAKAGIERLMADPAAPAAFASLKDLVRQLNPQGGVRFYPGSPVLIGELARKGDAITVCELRSDAYGDLARTMKARRPNAEVLHADGYEVAARASGRLFIHIDPPFERSDDYHRAVETSVAVLRRSPGATVMIWLPLKDLETFDRFLRMLEVHDLPPTVIAETRLRPLAQPMKMNGCALALLGPPAGLEADLNAICGWAAQTMGEDGAQARVWALS